MKTLISQINQDPELQRRGRHYSARIVFQSDQTALRLDIENGRIINAEYVSQDKPVDPVESTADFLIFSASSETWNKFLEDIPAPGYHDLSAMVDSGLATFSGHPLLWVANVLYIKGILNSLKPCFISEAKFP